MANLSGTEMESNKARGPGTLEEESTVITLGVHKCAVKCFPFWYDLGCKSYQNKTKKEDASSSSNKCKKVFLIFSETILYELTFVTEK